MHHLSSCWFLHQTETSQTFCLQTWRRWQLIVASEPFDLLHSFLSSFIHEHFLFAFQQLIVAFCFGSTAWPGGDVLAGYSWAGLASEATVGRCKWDCQQNVSRLSDFLKKMQASYQICCRNVEKALSLAFCLKHRNCESVCSPHKFHLHPINFPCGPSLSWMCQDRVTSCWILRFAIS